MASADNTRQHALLEQLKEKGFSLDQDILARIEALSAGLDFSPEGLKAPGIAGTAKSDLPMAVAQDIEFTVNEWGLVLIIREPAVKYLQGGGADGNRCGGQHCDSGGGRGHRRGLRHLCLRDLGLPRRHHHGR